MTEFVRRCELPVTPGEAFAWHERPGALERLLPPWESARVVRRNGGLEDGAEAELEVKIGPLPLRWLARHHDYIAGRQFCDRQIRGPLAQFDHCHRFSESPTGSVLEDHIDYEVPAGTAGRALGGGIIARKLDRMFAFRHAVTLDDIKAHARFRDRPRLSVAITGASGLVGSALAPLLTTGGHRTFGLNRGSGNEQRPNWNPETGQIGLPGDESCDAVVHLAGESIADRRWSASTKERIRASRVEATRKLCEALARLSTPPKTLICASAIGFYGNRGDEELYEESPGGRGFLADVCRAWEAATEPARAAGIRVVNLRFGMILSPRGGALAKMLLPFRLGGGGRIGSGKQWWSWISLDDVIGAIHHALLTESVTGPINVVAPTPLTNADFTRVLAAVLRRPAFFPVPATAARLALGEMASELLLASAHVVPQRLIESGYTFRHPTLELALRHMLGLTSASGNRTPA
jgi:uncharacterized protein (TIGR01777 family)